MSPFLSKKNVKLFALDLLFTILLISLLLFVRMQSRSYFNEVQGFSVALAEIEQDLQTQNLSSYDVAAVEGTLEEIDKVASRSIFLNQALLPLGVFLLWIILQGLLWRSLSGISFKKFVLHSILPTALFFAFILYFLDYLSYLMYVETAASLPVLIILLLALFISVYLALIAFAKRVSFKESFRFGMRNIKQLIIPFLLLLFSLFLFLILVTLIFIFTYAGIGFSLSLLTLPIIFLFLLLIILNYQRYALNNKIQSLH